MPYCIEKLVEVLLKSCCQKTLLNLRRTRLVPTTILIPTLTSVSTVARMRSTTAFQAAVLCLSVVPCGLKVTCIYALYGQRLSRQYFQSLFFRMFDLVLQLCRRVQSNLCDPRASSSGPCCWPKLLVHWRRPVGLGTALLCKLCPVDPCGRAGQYVLVVFCSSGEQSFCCTPCLLVVQESMRK